MTARILAVFDDAQQARSLIEADSIVLVVVDPLNIEPRTECAHVSELRPAPLTFRHFCALVFGYSADRSVADVSLKGKLFLKIADFAVEDLPVERSAGGAFFFNFLGAYYPYQAPCAA
ncbi:unnamed protein product [Bursaphelenchus xylophilus]|uniref:(pine wood nematode) hypothetical protein n=1 Tax=Bursaphelenchus xylophilus TaxID=6326 RepID=A0A1I7RX03_BURXY|nr:unnamed protein product [Bursaphelenchus xylophilus]CAG9110593.1 unnamed protein product [Bursaphelenchus xylophilus]